jgi:hypothetical protein
MSNSSTFRIYTPTPRPAIPLNKDVHNSPLWEFRSDSRSKELDESGRLGRFARRFGEGMDDLGSIAQGAEGEGKLTNEPKGDKKKKKPTKGRR